MKEESVGFIPSCSWRHHEDSWLLSLVPRTSDRHMLGRWSVPSSDKERKSETLCRYETLTRLFSTFQPPSLSVYGFYVKVFVSFCLWDRTLTSHGWMESISDDRRLFSWTKQKTRVKTHKYTESVRVFPVNWHQMMIKWKVKAGVLKPRVRFCVI